MRVIIQDDYDKCSVWAANHIAKRINEFAPTEENQGDTVVLHAYPLIDAELAFYANGVKLTQTYADYDYWEYVFIMPDDDVVITHEITDGFLPD